MNDQPLDRRGFLKRAVGASLVIGFPLPAFGEEEQAWWTAALEMMKKRDAHGVAIVVPSGAKGRKELARNLERIIAPLPSFHSALPPVAPFLLETVWVCAAGRRVGAKAGETLVLLDPRGKRVAGAKVDLSDDSRFLAGVGKLVNGEGRLAARAKKVRTPKIDQALRDLESDQRAHLGYSAINAQLEKGISAIVHAYQTSKNPKVKANLEGILRQRYWNQLQQEKGFPYGVKWKVEVNEPDPCPPCGMAAPSMTARKFLDFFVKP